MRALEQNAPGHPLNQGVVVFHVGANVARRWEDFREFSEADQEFFAELLPDVEEVDFGAGDVIEREPGRGGIDPVHVLEEQDVRAADLEPIGDPHAAKLLRQLAEMGIRPEQAAQEIRRLRRSRQDIREGHRAALHEQVQNDAGGLLSRLGIAHGGKTLDKRRVEKNYAWTVGQLNRRLNRRIGGADGDRQNFTLEQLNAAHDALPAVVAELEQELRDAAR
jgi:hypothetical protein